MTSTKPPSLPQRRSAAETHGAGVEVRSAIFGTRNVGLTPPVSGMFEAVFVAPPVEIDAPIEQVWAVLRDFASYPAWNPLNRYVRPASTGRVGDKIALGVSWGPYEREGAPVDPTTLAVVLEIAETLTIDQPLEALAWCDSRGSLHRAERVQYLTPLPGGHTLYRNEETMVGLLSPLIGRVFRERIDRGFAACGEALKRRVESLQRPVPGAI